MSLTRAAAVALVVASASLLVPTHEASARCWHGGWGWRCGAGPLALPFVAAVAAATAPLYYGPGYGAPPPAGGLLLSARAGVLPPAADYRRERPGQVDEQLGWSRPHLRWKGEAADG
ncbi:MAG TPA: hypothetical protein VGG57_15255 [Stellaceae bacterium]